MCHIGQIGRRLLQRLEEVVDQRADLVRLPPT